MLCLYSLSSCDIRCLDSKINCELLFYHYLGPNQIKKGCIISINMHDEPNFCFHYRVIKIRWNQICVPLFCAIKLSSLHDAHVNTCDFSYVTCISYYRVCLFVCNLTNFMF